MEDLQLTETIVRKDPECIKQCGLVGIPPSDMHKVYCDRKLPSLFSTVGTDLYCSMDYWL